jgi:GDP-4-dehydro-6-deoxy-D-mannose reductase
MGEAGDRMAVRRLLVTGLDGFVGGMARKLLADEALHNRFDLIIPSKVPELRDRESLAAVIRDTRPDCVLHLAGQSSVPVSVSDPLATYEVNFLGTLNLLEALEGCGFKGRLLYVSSGDVYGLVSPLQLPVTEDHPLHPRNPYSVSKAAAELLCMQWTFAKDFDIVVARPFNHVGPGQAEWFVVSDFARQIVEVKLGLRAPKIRVGSIDVTRDFTDVRDVVLAYLLLIERGRSGEIYNVCSGREHSIRDILQIFLELTGVDCRIILEASRQRPNEQTRMLGSFAKLKQEVGWQPVVDIKQSLQDVLNYWEGRLTNG